MPCLEHLTWGSYSLFSYLSFHYIQFMIFMVVSPTVSELLEGRSHDSYAGTTGSLAQNRHSVNGSG